MSYMEKKFHLDILKKIAKTVIVVTFSSMKQHLVTILNSITCMFFLKYNQCFDIISAVAVSIKTIIY